MDSKPLEFRERIENMTEQLQYIKENELKILADRLQYMRKIRYLLPKPEPKPWRFFWLFRRSSDELTHSYILSYLLNPKCPHGLGNTFLTSFLALLNIDPNIAKNNNDVEVGIEVGVGSRIIDILVDLGSKLIAIENKVYSPESPNQTFDIEKELLNDSRYVGKEIIFVFLTPSGEKACNNNFFPVSYRDVADIIRNLPLGVIKDVPPQTKALLEELLDHIKEEFEMAGEGWTLSERTRLYLEFYGDIVELTKACEEDIYRFTQMIESVAIGSLPSGDWKYGGYKGYQQLYKPDWWRQGQFYIRYEIWLNIEALVKREVCFMFQIDNSRREELLTLFDQDTSIKEKLVSINSQYRPIQRKIAVAFKKYSLNEDISDLPSVLSKAFEEHSFLSEKADEIVKQLEK